MVGVEPTTATSVGTIAPADTNTSECIGLTPTAHHTVTDTCPYIDILEQGIGVEPI